MYNSGLIGNCQVAALISNKGSIDWLCMPRPDSEPVFGRLLDKDGGYFTVESTLASQGKQYYLPNTVVLVTVVTCEDGSEFKITDFCPRFYQHGRVYRPIALFRKIEPLKGSSNITIKCKPICGWNKESAHCVRGNSHIRYEIRNDYLRLVTNMPMTYLCDEVSFSLKETIYFGLTWSAGIEDDLIQVTNHFLEQTIYYWNNWVKHCSIPTLYQKETILSSMILKLHCYEDTGAILAAVTTSLPEEISGTRNWDYRYCWLRDAYFVLSAFQNLGHFEEMEGFLKFLLNIAERHETSAERLRPVYKIDLSLPLPEQTYDNWAGYQNSKPVRSNNQAAEHVQNDVYGEMILALSPIYFDERFHHLRTKDHEHLLETLGRLCVKNISKPDAGLWELRNGWQEHSFSNLMCWAGLERLSRIKDQGYLQHFKIDLNKALSTAEAAIHAAVKDGVLRNGPDDESLDSALLELTTLRFPDVELNRATVLKIYSELNLGINNEQKSFLYRYKRKDDFGDPKSAFLICSFWLVQSLARIGQLDEAKKIMLDAMSAANNLGLLAEHFDPIQKIQSGNFPQAYSHVGQINAAFAISPKWSEIL